MPTRRPNDRAGMTLIEVLAGLVLLATVLASIGIARGRFVRQWADADRTLTASRAADRLLGDWLSGPAARVPLDQSGDLPESNGCTWHTQLIKSGDPSLGLRTVRLSVFDTAVGRTQRAPLFAVDFALPEPAAVKVEPVPGAAP